MIFGRPNRQIKASYNAKLMPSLWHVIDALSMGRLDPTDARGYIRCGQLKQLQRDPSAALKWYEHDLKLISERYSRFHELKN